MQTADLIIAGIVLWLMLACVCLGYWIIRVVERQRRRARPTPAQLEAWVNRWHRP